MADHCLAFALSDPSNDTFEKKCDHNHAEIFAECHKLGESLATIETACAELQSKEERDDTTCLVLKAKKDILAWKVHQLRTVNQDQAKSDVLDPQFGIIGHGLGHEVLATQIQRITVRLVC